MPLLSLDRTLIDVGGPSPQSATSAGVTLTNIGTAPLSAIAASIAGS